MKLEDIVCSLKLAKRLKEIGVKQESLFYWDKNKNEDYEVTDDPTVAYELSLSLFTASELFEILPYTVDTKKDKPFNNFRFDMTIFNLVNKLEENGLLVMKKHYSINYHCDTYDPSDFPAFPRKLFEKNIHDENLANAVAKVIICLYEDWEMKFV